MHRLELNDGTVFSVPFVSEVDRFRVVIGDLRAAGCHGRFRLLFGLTIPDMFALGSHSFS
jgi:hypothetical protein